MRIAVIADIHGNLAGLQAVLDDIKSRAVDAIVCLGDLVEGGEDNDAVVSLIRSLPISVLRGNHDEIHDCRLSPKNAEWLAALPEYSRIDDVLFSHLSPRKKQLSISNNVEAWNVFDETDFRICFLGHLHYPALYGFANDAPCEARSYLVDTGVVGLKRDDRYIVSFGAIGYPRAGGRFLRYGIYDLTENSIEFIKLNGPLLPYGICS